MPNIFGRKRSSRAAAENPTLEVNPSKSQEPTEATSNNMAAQAPAPVAEPVAVEPSPSPAAAAPVALAQSYSPVNEYEPTDADRMAEDENENPEDNDDDDDDEDQVKEWDEGGKSHCGYGDSVHDTLMAIGESIHKVVGEPSENVHGTMLSIGNWFQEASYAARDLQRGKMDVAEETAAAMKSVASVVSGDEGDNHKDDDRNDEVMMESKAEDKLSPVKEESSMMSGISGK